MITRPLDLASKLSPPPRNFDALCFVNLGALGLFFLLFGSRFVLAPGVGAEFQLPQVEGAETGAATTTHFITVVNAGQIFAGDGVRDMEGVRAWLRAGAAKQKDPVLLIHMNGKVATSVLTELTGIAKAEGYRVQIAATEPPKAASAAAGAGAPSPR